MILREPLDVVIERVETRRGDDPRLAHRAAEPVLLDPRLRHQLGGAGKQRAKGTAEPFREAERHRVEIAADLCRRNPERNRGVGDSRAVQMRREAELAGGLHDGAQLVWLPDGAAGARVRVLNRNHRGARDVEPVGHPGRSANLLGRDPAVDAGQPARLKTRVHGCTAELGNHDVRGLLDDQLGAAPAEDRQRDLVGHRRRRKVDGLLLPEERCGSPLELEHGRVLAALLVPDLGRGHRGAHPCRRCGLRVGAEVDHPAITL